MKNTERIAVIGGGAAGMMAAGAALTLGADVTVFEHRDKPLKKLRITGKGRCNLTNNCEREEFLSHVLRNPRFLYTALSAFSPANTMSFFEELGLPLKTERGRRVFPLSDKAADVAEALCRYADGAKQIYRHVRGLKVENGEICGVYADVFYPFDAVILACGGLSYPVTGSDGSGFSLAREAGHTVTSLSPSLVPLTSPSPYPERMQGLSLKNVSLTVRRKEGGKVIYRDFGEMMFAHFGLTGPMVLSASAFLQGEDLTALEAVIDLKPALDEKTLDARLLNDFSKYTNRNFDNALSSLLPAKMIPVMVEYIGIPATKKVHLITREERRKLLSALKGFSLPLSGFRPIAEAIVTAGGVDVREISPKTMMSKKVKNLFFAGEMLDVDAYTGGYNLQIAFSTGRLAGLSAARAVLDEKCKESFKEKNMTYKIALDGPSGAGKSTLARMIAANRNIVYVDTGALYRSVGLYMKQNGISPDDGEAVTAALSNVRLSMCFREGKQCILLGGKEVGDSIRTSEISSYASKVSAIPAVRAFLLDTQRDIARHASVIMDGRDIGTVIFPDAEVKIFLTASAEARARRRTAELAEKGMPEPYEKVLAQMKERDKNDAERAVAPAVPAKDAVILDNSDLDLAGTLEAALRIIKEKLGEA